jgi:hypothetical protein
MQDTLALTATVDPAAGVATVTVRNREFGPSAYSRLRDDLRWVAANGPQRLVLDLAVTGQFTEQLITVIAATRRQLPGRCVLEVRSARPAVRNLLDLA